MEIHALCCGRQHAIEQNIGLLAPSFVAGQDGKADKVLRRDPIGIGCGFVNCRIGAHDQAFGVIRSQIVAAAVWANVVAIESPLPLGCTGEIFRRSRGLVQRQSSFHHRGVIGGEARIEEPSIPPGVAEAVASRHVTFDEGERLLSFGKPRGLVEHSARICQSRDHQSIPVSKPLIVQTRSDALLTRRQEFMPQCSKAGFVGRGTVTQKTSSEFVRVSAGTA